MKIPPLLAWVRDDPNGPDWLAVLPQVLATCAERWSLQIEPPFDGSHVSYAAPAITDAGERVVVKVQFPDRESDHEADALKVYAGRGHVRLLAHAPDLNALLVECCEPGTSLGQAPETNVDALTLAILREVWPAQGSFLELRSEAVLWIQALEEAALKDDKSNGPARGTAYFGQAMRVLNALVASQASPVFVNRDLHRDNVLQANREPWLVIDPKPILAEREFALANRLPMFGTTEIEDAQSDVISRLNRYAGTLELDAHRARAWAFARAVLWSLDGSRLGPHFSRVAGPL